MKTEQRVIVVFPTTTDALHLEYVCRAEGEQRLRTLAEANSIRVDGFYRRVL